MFTDAAGAPDGAALDVGMAVAPGLGLSEVGGVGDGVTGGDDEVGGVGVGLDGGDGEVGGVGVGLDGGDGLGDCDGGQVEDGAGPAGSGIGASRLMLNFEAGGASGQPGLFNQGFFNWRAPTASASARPPPRTELWRSLLWPIAAVWPASVAVCCSWPMASAPEPIITTNAAIAAAGRSQAAARTGTL